MKAGIYIAILILLSIFDTSCTNAQRESRIENHKEEADFELNNPTPPAGYVRYFDCDSNAVYRYVDGDTIRIYSWGGSIAMDEDEMKSFQKEDDFNVFRYPKLKQENGTYVVVILEFTEFLFRNDTLYLLDTYNDVQINKMLEINDQMMNGEISKEEFENKTSEISKQDFGFVPQYKLVYHSTIFKKNKLINLPHDLNFRNESIELISQWNKDGKEFYKVLLHSKFPKDITLIFNEDMSFLDLEGCEH